MIQRRTTVHRLHGGMFDGYHVAAASDAIVLSVKMHGRFERFSEYIAGSGKWVFACVTNDPRGHVCEAF